MNLQRKEIRIRGRIQGVGARPFLYRLACQYGLTGSVRNDPEGVHLQIQGSGTKISEFLTILQDLGCYPDAPPLMRIEMLRFSDLEILNEETDFRILQSGSDGSPISQVTPDTAVCGLCLCEMNDRRDFRHRYPFINCTQCGPRYTIIQSIPYDRPNTTMSEFSLCSRCRAQYEDISDRRFHAQPVACPVCGPKIRLTDNHGGELETDSDRVIARTAQMLHRGKIAAIKGIGGFHLAADAFNEEAVRRLRQRKGRAAKPFAMMAGSMEVIQTIAAVSPQAEELLTSPESPIVLLPKRIPNDVAVSAAEGTDTFGLMLPYSPLHHLLFAEKGIELLVMTSANFSEEPLLCDNREALDRLSGIADVFLMHDRDIFRQIDDSVLHVIDDSPAFVRRARGYVPTPIFRRLSAQKEIFAAGPDLKNTFCFLKGDQYLLSEHIGDLAEGRAYRHYVKSAEHLRKLFEVNPSVVVCDLHPGYLSTQFACTLPAEQLLHVQHHWAHIASVLAEYGKEPQERVIGLAADGTGYGTDGAIWGCECMLASLLDFERFGHLAYTPLAGGDAASKEAIRPLLGLLYGQDVPGIDSLLAKIEPDEKRIEAVRTQIGKKINTILSSSLGRLFDAAAALTGLGIENRFEAELPMALEAAADVNENGSYSFSMYTSSEGVFLLDPRVLFRCMIEDRMKGAGASILAARFHNTIAAGLLEWARRAREKTGIQTAALSGGVFCNRYLSKRLIRLLREDGFAVLFNRQAPANDGGIALGQAAIAAAKIET